MTITVISVLKVTSANNGLRIFLVWVLEGVIHDGHQRQPSLPGSGDDLIGRQDEAVPTRVPQLKGVGILDALVVGPVNGATAGLVCK